MNAVGWQGAEITGSDLRGPFDAAFRARALEILHAHKTVCYRDQNLTDVQFRDFALLFGPLEPRIAAYDRGERFQDLHLMTNVAADGTLSAGHQDTANRGWHSDKSYKPKPSMTTLLYALAVPNEGGETEFADTEAAYAALPDATKQRIAGLRVRHHWEFAYDGKPGFREATDNEKRANPPAVHPLVRTHPVTGRKALYLSYFAADIVDLPRTEGRALLDELTEHTIQERFISAHHWQRGDVVMWDNRCLMHRGRPYDHNTQPRTLMRAVVQGDIPV